MAEMNLKCKVGADEQKEKHLHLWLTQEHFKGQSQTSEVLT